MTRPPPDWGKRLAYFAAGVIALGCLGLLLWGVTDPKRTQVAWDAIELTSPPPLPAADFLREVRVTGSFPETLDTADVKQMERLTQALARHEWVERVVEVRPAGPGRLAIDLVYRRPVARLARGGQTHLVDRTGKFLLPLHPGQGETLVRLVGFDGNDTTWLADAAALAGRLHPDLDAWGIDSLVLVKLRPLELIELALRTRGGTLIYWKTLTGGRDEPPEEEKVTRLRLYKERYHTLDLPAGQVLDVRHREGIQRKAGGG